jgi:hypothetical protein
MEGFVCEVYRMLLAGGKGRRESRGTIGVGHARSHLAGFVGQGCRMMGRVRVDGLTVNVRSLEMGISRSAALNREDIGRWSSHRNCGFVVRLADEVKRVNISSRRGPSGLGRLCSLHATQSDPC